MSPTPSSRSDMAAIPAWLWSLLGVAPSTRAGRSSCAAAATSDGGVLRERGTLSAAQHQTSDVFGYKWHQRDTFESEAMLERTRRWLTERYGDVVERRVLVRASRPSRCSWTPAAVPPTPHSRSSDAALRTVRYLGVDVSEAVDVAAARLAEAA